MNNNRDVCQKPNSGDETVGLCPPNTLSNYWYNRLLFQLIIKTICVYFHLLLRLKYRSEKKLIDKSSIENVLSFRTLVVSYLSLQLSARLSKTFRNRFTRLLWFTNNIIEQTIANTFAKEVKDIERFRPTVSQHNSKSFSRSLRFNELLISFGVESRDRRKGQKFLLNFWTELKFPEKNYFKNFIEKLIESQFHLIWRLISIST